MYFASAIVFLSIGTALGSRNSFIPRQHASRNLHMPRQHNVTGAIYGISNSMTSVTSSIQQLFSMTDYSEIDPEIMSPLIVGVTSTSKDFFLQKQILLEAAGQSTSLISDVVDTNSFLNLFARLNTTLVGGMPDARLKVAIQWYGILFALYKRNQYSQL
jgi:hypothetical protein